MDQPKVETLGPEWRVYKTEKEGAGWKITMANSRNGFRDWLYYPYHPEITPALMIEIQDQKMDAPSLSLVMRHAEM